tara:strand:+ start:161 stop:730 length:570 start_codon:yes stop_codon:yes gene_type:complete
MILYSLKNISHKIDSKKVISNLSNRINSGEITEIRGKNGSGKTTLLKILTGLIYSKDLHCHTEIQNNISYLGHKNGLVEEITLRQNFEILDLDLKNDLFNKFNLARSKNQKVFNLSYGEKRKAALIRVICSNRKIWIMDEPFAGLDSSSISELKIIIKMHVDTGGTVILSNHQEELKDSKKINLEFKDD